MRNTYILLLLLMTASVSCNNNSSPGENKSAAAKAVEAPQSKLKEEGTQKLVSFISDYYGLKDAFVSTSSIKADSAALKLLNSAGVLSDYLKNDTANGAALMPYLDTITTETKNLLAAKDETCEKKRVPFSKISDQLYTMLKKADVKNAGIYQEHCPMAFDDKGANWLSNEAEIKNPYFGKKMLECGDVTDSLK